MTELLRGRDNRQHQREADHRKRRAIALRKVEQWLNELDAERTEHSIPFDGQAFSFTFRTLKQKINAEHFAPIERLWCHQFLYMTSLQRIDAYNLRCDPVYPPVTVTRASSRRTISQATQSRRLEYWEDQFRLRVVKLAGSPSASDSDWLGLALWSAMSRGQLCEASLLKSLRDRLCATDGIFEVGLAGRLAIRLEVVSEDGDSGRPIQRGNYHDSDGLRRVHHFYPDGMTLALMRRWLASERSLDARQKVIVTIRKAIWGKEKPRYEFRELDDLTRYGIWLADLRPNTVGSEALCEVARGGWSSLAVDDVAFALLAEKHAKMKAAKTVAPEYVRPRLPQFIGSSWAILDDLQRTLSRRGNIWPRSADVALDLIGLEARTEPNSIERLIITWLGHLLDVEKLKVSSVFTYNSRISARLVAAFEGHSLDSLDGVDFSTLYASIIDDIDLPVTRSQVTGRIAQMHHFGIRHPDFHLLPLVEPLGDRKDPSAVRARYFPASKLPEIFEQFEAMAGPISDISDMMKVACLLAYRAGLRLGEVVKLRKCDVEPSSERWLFIVPNRFGNNKTSAARRQIPLGALLTTTERDVFERFMRARERLRSDQPLFADAVSGGIVDARWLSRTVSQALNNALGDKGWTFHHLRHAAVNNLFLVLEDEPELAHSLSGWALEQQSRIVRSIVGDPTAKQKRYIALATVIGHSNPQQTFESYIHLVEPVLAARRFRQPTLSDRKLYAAALGRQIHLMSRIQNDGDAAFIITKELSEWVEKDVKPLKPRGRKPKRAIEKTQDDQHSPFDQILIALKLIEDGGTIEEAAVASSASSDDVARWLEAARGLAALKTKRGNSRFFSLRRMERNADVEGATRELLLPTLPKSREEWSLSRHLLAHLWDRYLNKRTRPEVQWAVEYYLENADPSNAGLPFTKSADVKRFIQLFERAALADFRWRLDLAKVAPQALTQWKIKDFGLKVEVESTASGVARATVQDRTRPGPAPVGNGRLFLMNAGEMRSQHIPWDKRSSASLRFGIHIFAIALGVMK